MLQPIIEESIKHNELKKFFAEYIGATNRSNDNYFVAGGEFKAKHIQ
jgi:hypothetical protein